MPLSLHSRQIGDVTVVRCSGRIIEGPESAALKDHLAELSRDPFVVLNLGEVDFVDSSGLGLLVRLLTRSHAAGGDLKLCAVRPRIREVVRITRLDTLFELPASEDDAVQAFYRQTASKTTSRRLGTQILCVGRSADVQAYLRELLGAAGYGVMAVGNVADALTLAKATRPKLVVIAIDGSGASDTRVVETFRNLEPALATIALPADFSGHDAGEAGERLLNQVRTILGGQ
jgi:anti-sigma B factor antagonist